MKWKKDHILTAAAVILVGILIFLAFQYKSSQVVYTLPTPLPNEPLSPSFDPNGNAVNPTPVESQDEYEYPSPAQSGLTSDIATYGSLSAYGAHKGDINVLILKQNGKETIIATTSNMSGSPVQRAEFDAVSFSPKGNFLIYNTIGWEFSYRTIYDLQTHSIVATTENGQFTQNESLFYSCYLNNFGGERDAKIYSLPGFKVKHDFYTEFPELNNYMFLKCTEDSAHTHLVLDFSGGESAPQTHKILNVSLITGELESIR